MPLHQLDIIPRDLLFFRDARPLAASDVGHGADWPLPQMLHDALSHACHRAWPECQSWEHKHNKNDKDANPHSSDRFGYLKTVGPWPCRENVLHLPTPADLQPDGQVMAPMVMSAGNSNLPQPLTHAVGSLDEPSKESIPRWLPANLYADYLAGKALAVSRPDALFDTERRIGIAIDGATHATVKGKLYSAEYMRLREGFSMRAWADADYRHPHGTRTDVLAELLRHDSSIVIGGQQGVAEVHATVAKSVGLPTSHLPRGTTRIKWVLLSPALFDGCLPTWVDPTTGRVMLKQGDTNRQPGEMRHLWRQRIAELPGIGARLVAARIPKPIAFSGWDQRLKGPKATQLAVPAGAVYYFEADHDAAALDLVKALAWDGHGAPTPSVANRRSTHLGQKGFGLGVCGAWDFLHVNTRSKES